MKDADELQQVVVLFARQLDDGGLAFPERTAEHRLQHRRPHGHDGLDHMTWT